MAPRPDAACPIRTGEPCTLCHHGASGPHDCPLVYLVMDDPELKEGLADQRRTLVAARRATRPSETSRTQEDADTTTTDNRPTSPLVDVAWLREHSGDADVIALDASIPPNDAGGRRIPGVRRFDLEGEFSQKGPLPHTMPSAQAFQTAARRLGITSASTVVVYDVAELYSAARAWWMFTAMGHEKVAVLDGGLAAWEAAGHPVEEQAPERPSDDLVPQEDPFVAAPVPGRIVDAETVAGALDSGRPAVVDARSNARFLGTAPEPRPGLRGGHMPGAANLPYTDVQREGRMLSPDELAPLVEKALGGRDAAIMSCGSGVTACVVALAATLAGRDDLAVYDGSWTEWGAQDSGRPVTTDDR